MTKPECHDPNCRCHVWYERYAAAIEKRMEAKKQAKALRDRRTT